MIKALGSYSHNLCTDLREGRGCNLPVPPPLVGLRCNDVSAEECERTVILDRLGKPRPVGGDFLSQKRHDADDKEGSERSVP